MSVAADARSYPCDEVGYSYVTRGRTISEADVIFHAGQTGDLYPQHLDAEVARASSYGQRLVHGTLTLSVAMGLKFDTDPAKGVRISYGYEHLRFRRPVFIGDTIRSKVEVIASEMDARRPEMKRVVEKMNVVNQHDETVLSVEHILVRFAQ